MWMQQEAGPQRPDAGLDSALPRVGDRPPVAIPSGHVGPVMLPGTGRLIWWTGRVAIGLRHEPAPQQHAFSQSAEWIQKLMLDTGRGAGRPT